MLNSNTLITFKISSANGLVLLSGLLYLYGLLLFRVLVNAFSMSSASFSHSFFYSSFSVCFLHVVCRFSGHKVCSSLDYMQPKVV